MDTNDAGQMNPGAEKALAAARELLTPWAGQATQPEANRLDVALAPTELMTAVAALSEGRWGVLGAITGLDAREAGFEVLYHFCAGPAVVTLRVRTPRAAASVPSVHKLVPAAVLFERELSEMFGINIAGAANPERLFLPDDWPQGIFPLRKDFAPETLAGTASESPGPDARA